MESLQEQTVGEIVSNDFRTAGIFKKYGLDFCCGGKRMLSDACKRKNLDIDRLLADISALPDDEGKQQNFKEWSPDFLIDYIINQHHGYVRNKLPEIKAYAQKVAKVHGKTYPVLDDMLGIFLLLKDEMLSHIEAEEKVLFPYIKKLVSIKSGDSDTTPAAGNGMGRQTIEMMEQEHEEAGALMARLEELSNGFNPPEGACTTFRVYFKNLRAFREDLHKHVHLENNILFPRALALEKELR